MRILVFFSFLLLGFGLSGFSVAKADSEKTSDLRIENVSNEDNSPELLEMREYMKNQQQKQQKISLLALDLDEAKIELELREKKAAMGQYIKEGGFKKVGSLKGINGSDNKFKDSLGNDNDPEIKSIFITNSSKQAVLDADGNEVTVKEGDNLGGIKVKKIDSNEVTLVRENNEEFKVFIKQ